MLLQSSFVLPFCDSNAQKFVPVKCGQFSILFPTEFCEEISPILFLNFDFKKCLWEGVRIARHSSEYELLEVKKRR